MPKGNFYARYYVGHKGKFGNEFLEFEITEKGLVSLTTLGTDSALTQTFGLIEVTFYDTAALCQQFQLQK